MDIIPTPANMRQGSNFNFESLNQYDYSNLDSVVNQPVNIADVFSQDIPPIPFENASFRPPMPDADDGPDQPRMINYFWQEPLIQQTASWLGLFVDQGQVVELRALNVSSGNAKLTYSGFYSSDYLASMAKDALDLTSGADGVYFTLNPLDKNLLARRNNRVDVAKDTAADADVLNRRWLLIDTDPVRKSGMSATDEEKQQAWNLTRSVHQWLQEQGWPEPILADSGNGYHLLYRVDLPCNDDGLIKTVLENLATRFDNERVKIDTKVFNPSRIVKLYGTVARKGDSISQRPHRWTGVLAIPPQIVPVPKAQLEQVGKPVVKERVKELPPLDRPMTNLIPTKDRIERARKYLQKVPPAVSGDYGHNQTFKAACILVDRFKLTIEDALPLFKEWNETCQPPWDEKDLLKKLKDASAKVGVQEPVNGQLSGLLNQNDRGDSENGFEVSQTLEAPDDPHRLARIYLNQDKQGKGTLTLRFWNGDWYRWNGRVYRQVSEAEVRAGLTSSIKRDFDRFNLLEQFGPSSQQDDEPGDSKPKTTRKVTKTLVGNVLQALQSQCFVSSDKTMPCWLEEEGAYPAEEMLVAQNGLVHIPSLLDGRKNLLPSTPNLFTTVAVDYDIDFNAGPPTTWLKFLDDLWSGDPESVALLQEWMGYCLTQDTSQQKMLMIVGPKRAGKGTIGKVMTEMVGKANVVGPTLSSLARNFGLSALLNKPVAIISDARFSGRLAEQALIVENLLSISGEDTLTIDRKNRDHLTIKLPTRFTIMTNELPRLTDASAALPSRLLVLQLTRSWFNKEDIQLGQKLLKEKSGIFLWAIEGLRRIRKRGRFSQPDSGKDTIRRMEELSSPITAFVQDRCELGPDKEILKPSLFMEWRTWCQSSGHDPGNQATFGRNLIAAFPDLKTSRPRDDAGGRFSNYRGIGLTRL